MTSIPLSRSGSAPLSPLAVAAAIPLNTDMDLPAVEYYNIYLRGLILLTTA